SCDSFDSYTSPMQSAFPTASDNDMLNRIKKLDQYLGQMKSSIDANKRSRSTRYSIVLASQRASRVQHHRRGIAFAAQCRDIDHDLFLISCFFPARVRRNDFGISSRRRHVAE